MIWRKLGQSQGVFADLAGIEQTLSQYNSGQQQTDRRYPAAMRRNLHEAGMSRLLADAPETVAPLLAGEAVPSQVTMWHAAAVNHLLATVDGSLAITIGVNYLAFIPIYMAGSAEQLQWLGERVHRGAYGAMGLTEIAHGSNLLANETSAVSDGDHYRLMGEKQLINGGSQHELLTILARSGTSRTAFSLFLAERDATVSSPKRWHTLPMPSADIASVRLDGTCASLLGRKGRGFSLLQKTFAISRGGISPLAAGLANRAVALSAEYAQQRHVNGNPILHLNPIADHLLTMRSLDLLISALSLKTCALLNQYGAAASIHGAAAKVVCCTLAEQLVTEGRYLHGARALITDAPYHALVRDVMLYATFDGTVHVVLDQLQARLAQLVAQPVSATSPLAVVRAAYVAPPRPLVQVCRLSPRPLFIDPRAYLTELADVATSADLTPVITLTDQLFEAVREWRTDGSWEADQPLRLRSAKLYGELEALIALVELTDAGCRAALGLKPLAAAEKPAASIVTYALYSFAGQLAHALSVLRGGSTSLDALVHRCHAQAATQRMEILTNRELLWRDL